MRHKLISLGSTVGVLSCCLLGCEATNQSDIRHTAHHSKIQTTTVTLASFHASPSLVQQPQPKATSKANTQDAAQASATKPVQKIPPQANKKDTEEDTAAATKNIKTLYTAPSSASALAIASAALGSTQDMTNGGQEASENIGITTSFRQALQPSVSIGDGGSIGKRGLQRGSPLTGSNNLNIFTPRSNGITNRCQELITVGFFADITGCRNHFSR